MESRLGVKVEASAAAPLRMQMYDYIQRNPGAHILEMAEAFGLTHPTVMYHLALLEDEGYVVSSIWGKRRVHFDTQGHFTLWEREILAVFAIKEARAMIEWVSTHPGTFPREVARELGISETTVKRYVPELLRLHVVQEEDGSFRRRLRISRVFKRRGLVLLGKLTVDARPRANLEALLDEESESASN